ncbi:hypothetical protein CY35_06G007800 [Sphagnum magellanicum]|nr:hypothetical protein CY35_06G007800 [Sphagnum magellanicum]
MTEQNQKQARCKTLSGTSPNLPLGTYLVRKSAIRARSRFAEAECARALRCRVWCALGCFVSRHLNPQARCSSSSAPQSHMYELLLVGFLNENADHEVERWLVQQTW